MIRRDRAALRLTAMLALASSCLPGSTAARAASAADAPRPPVIIVPGAPAIQLVDGVTGQRMWPGPWRMLGWHGNDELALDLANPESTTLRPGDLVREVRIAGFTIPVRGYDGLEAKLRALGYTQGDLDRPQPGEYYIFLFDWRLSVETSGRRLAGAIRELYERLPPGTPRAIVVGHSIGGLLGRYALMYGESPLGAEGPLPPVTWEGAAHVDTLYLVATPNGGTFLALDALQRGAIWWKHWGAFSPAVLATFPMMYDLLPARPEPLLDLRGRPLAWSLDRAEDWQKLGWGPLRPGSPFTRRRSETGDGVDAVDAFEMVRNQLVRSQRTREALLQTGPRPNPTTLHLVGGRCQTAQRTAVVVERPGGAPSVRFKVGGDDSRSELPDTPFLREPGDSMITASSLVAAGLPREPTGSLVFASTLYACDSHRYLPSSVVLLRDLERLLSGPAESGAPVPAGSRRPAGRR